MNVRLALRDEKVNIFAMTEGNPNSINPHQIILCKKELRDRNKIGPFLLDAKRSDPKYRMSSEGKELLKIVATNDFELRYLAYIDCQLRVAIRPGLFETLNQGGYFSIWDAISPQKYFQGAKEGFLYLFRVYRLYHSIDDALLERGRSGRNWFYNLERIVDVDLTNPVIKEADYRKLKEDLLRLLIQNNYLLEKLDSDYMDQLTFADERTEENDLKDNISKVVIDDSPAKAYVPRPREKKELTEGRDSNNIYPRDPKIAINALKRSGFKCECDEAHQTFTRKRDGKPYMEPHHLIPLSKHADFCHDLDVEANIVSLCSHCHNLIHYGYDYQGILKRLYEQRKAQLGDAGIPVEFAELVEYYR